MNFEALNENLAKANEGFSNENLVITFGTTVPAGVKISDGKGRGVPLSKGDHMVAVIGVKRLKGVAKKFDFCLLSVALATGEIFDVSVDGLYPPIEQTPTKMYHINCVHNAKGYPVIVFDTVKPPQPIVNATNENSWVNP